MALCASVKKVLNLSHMHENKPSARDIELVRYCPGDAFFPFIFLSQFFVLWCCSVNIFSSILHNAYSSYTRRTYICNVQSSIIHLFGYQCRRCRRWYAFLARQQIFCCHRIEKRNNSFCIVFQFFCTRNFSFLFNLFCVSDLVYNDTNISMRLVQPRNLFHFLNLSHESKKHLPNVSQCRIDDSNGS